MLLLGLAASLTACAGRATTREIRAELSNGQISSLRERIEEEFEDQEDMVSALNLARLYQLEGTWTRSRAAYDQALGILEEYESRAIVSIRNLTGQIGSFLLARGSQGYYGTGYERSLLHTFNAFNYLMLQDFAGAAVEARKMEARQEMWLLESEARLARHLQEKDEKSPDSVALPPQYTMREIVSREEVRALVNSYQEPFSYVLSSIFNRLAGHSGFAEVSMKRAVALAPGSAKLFQDAWGGRAGSKAPAGDELPAVPPRPGRGYSGELFGLGDDEQELTVIFLAGLAPALFVEHVRIPFPYVGYIVVDLPSYVNPLYQDGAFSLTVDDRNLALYPLLSTENLAYRTLLDEVELEITAAFTRAMVRAGASATTRAIVSSHEDIRGFASLAAYLTTALMDLFSTSISKAIRNWELLPNKGSVAMGVVPKGGLLMVRAGSRSGYLSLPENASGVIVLATQLPNTSVRLDYVTY